MGATFDQKLMNMINHQDLLDQLRWRYATQNIQNIAGAS
jgi:hypothetical protein